VRWELHEPLPPAQVVPKRDFCFLLALLSLAFGLAAQNFRVNAPLRRWSPTSVQDPVFHSPYGQVAVS